MMGWWAGAEHASDCLRDVGAVSYTHLDVYKRQVQCCVEAIRQGVHTVNIQDGRIPHSILIEILSNEGIGTVFY